MFKQRSNSPTAPSQITFNQILADLANLQTYYDSKPPDKDEKFNIFEIVDEKKKENLKEAYICPFPYHFKEEANIESLDTTTNVNSTESSFSLKEQLNSNYDHCTRFIGVTKQLLKYPEKLVILGVQIDSMRKELTEIISTIESENEEIHIIN
ncbi:hypothetical protein G9A89_019013 [Geosiphon pyriformis]|nr:hypothetical protein G9A89_019013 [Geosiphon pyriformis]